MKTIFILKRPRAATNEAIIKGTYKYKASNNPKIRLLASGLTLRFAITASEILSKMKLENEIWSVTSFNELAREGIATDRANSHSNKNNKSYVEVCFGEEIPTVAVSEYQKLYADQIRKWVKGNYVSVGMMG